jgi:hypothetical protein
MRAVALGRHLGLQDIFSIPVVLISRIPVQMVIQPDSQARERRLVSKRVDLNRKDDATESTVRFDLDERDGATTVRLTHSGLITENSRTSHKGWPQIIAWLQAYVEHHV